MVYNGNINPDPNIALDMKIALIHSLVVLTCIPVTKVVMVLCEVFGNYSLLLPNVPS